MNNQLSSAMSSHSNEQEPNSRRMRNIFNVKNKSKARQIQASLVYTFLIAVAAIALNVVVSEKSSLSILYTNMIFGSGSTVASRIDNAWSVLFVSNQTNPTSFYYNSTSSTLGRSDFFLGVTQFGASDSDVSSSQLKLFLPDNTSGIANLSGLDVTKYINPSFPNHLGTIMLPEVGAGIGIVYNVAPFQNNAYNLNFTAKLLGDIFCANITKWNDPAIVALNPSFDFTTVNNTITIIGRSDSSGSTQILTGYMSKYSSNFNKAIGSSSQPTWPATFQLRSASSDLLYATETIPYSISYSPLDSIGALIYYRVASVVNKNNITVYPTATSIQASMINSTSIGIKKHNYISITDSNVINAYPISIYTFILINEFYWFNATGSNPSSCNSITSMIDYWRYAWTSPEAKTTASSLGFIPLSDDVVASNLEALKSVHCKNESVMNTLDFRSNSLQFYNDGIFTFNIGPTKMGFRGSVKFTDRIYSNPSNFSIAPIGTIIFSLFFIIFSLISIFTVINSFYRVINSDTHGLQTSFYSIASAPTGPELKRPSMLDKPLIIVKNPRFTAENLLFLISSIPTIIQFFCVSLNKSKVIQDNQISLEILKYSGIGIDKSYFISLMFFSTIWILGVLFATFWFRYVKENYTISIIKYAKPISKYMSYFALFATFFSMPVFLMITSVFDCRFNPLSGLFISVYDPVNIVCFSGIHWIMVGFAYLIGFPFAFLAINKTHYLVSNFKMKFDFKQKEWSSIYMQFFKVTTAVLFIVSSNAVFQVVSSIFAFIFGLCLLIKRPNQVPWFDLIKGSAYLIYGSLCFVLFVCEIVVQDSDFITRLAISNSLPWIIVGFSGALIILAIWVYTAHLPDLGSQEVRKKQRKEFEVIFSYLRSAQQNKNLEFDAGEDNNEIISSGLKLGLLTPLQAKYIAKTIDNNQRTVLEVFRSSNKNYQTFMKLMEKPVWKILQKDFNYQKSNGPRFTRIGEKMNEVNNDSDQTEDDNEDYDY